MNKLIIILAGSFLLLQLTDSAHAQWPAYFGAKKQTMVTESQLREALVKANRLTNTGYVVGAVGSLAAVAGGVIYSTALVDLQTAQYYNIDFISNRARLGSYALWGGVGLVAAALPVIILGTSRKTVLEVVLANHTSKINVGPYMTLNDNRPAAGLTVGLTFR